MIQDSELRRGIENARINVEKLVTEALHSENIERIIENGGMIEQYLERVMARKAILENVREFSPEVREAFRFFEKSCEAALKKMKNHYESVEQARLSSIDYTEVVSKEKNDIASIINSTEENVLEEVNTIDSVEEMYRKAIASDSLKIKEQIRDRLQARYEHLMNQVYATTLADQLSNQEINDLYQQIDTLHRYRKELESQIEETKSVSDRQLEESIVEPIYVNVNAEEQIEQPIFIPTMEELNDLHQKSVESSDCNEMVATSNTLEQSLRKLNEMLQKGVIPVEAIEETNKKIEAIREAIQDIDSHVESYRHVSENVLLSSENVEYYYQEAINTTDKSYLIEIANYLDDNCLVCSEYMERHGITSVQLQNRMEDIKSKVAFIDQRLSSFDNEIIKKENINLWSEEELEKLCNKAMNTTRLSTKRKIIKDLTKYAEKLENELAQNMLSEEVKNKVSSQMYEVLEKKAELERHMEVNSQIAKKTGIKNLFVNTSLFTKQFTKHKKSNPKKAWSLQKKTVVYGIGAGMIALAFSAIVGLAKERKEEAAQGKELGKKVSDTILDGFAKIKEEHSQKAISNTASISSKMFYSSVENMKFGVLTQETKEERIMDLVKELKDRFNVHDGLNVTTEQALALYIYLNASNSYENPNDILVLDKLTRENLMKKYYVGLTKDTEEFKTYELDDSDLSRLSADMYGLRNAALNRVVLLNDQGKYDESREIISIFKDFISEESLKDEASVLTASIQKMQTSNKQEKKENIYRYYNYIFAGPKSNIRNFNQYGHYEDGDGKEMTYENQTLSIRTFTWFMDGFVDLNITNNLIPQDIINAKEAKLRDLSSIHRILGFQNCSNNYYRYDFDTPIDNKIKKSSSTRKPSSTSTNIANVLETDKLNEEMNEGLKEHTQVGDSFKLSDQSTVTIVDSGPSDTTVVVQPDPGSAKVEDTTPEGTTEKETIEGGGNETTESINFEKDSSEEIINPGGEIIPEESGEYEESISFEEDFPEESYEEPISFEEDFPEESYEEPISFEEDFPEESYEESISFEEYSTQAEIYELYSLREELVNTVSDIPEYTESEECYVKTYHI